MIQSYYDISRASIMIYFFNMEQIYQNLNYCIYSTAINISANHYE